MTTYDRDLVLAAIHAYHARGWVVIPVHGITDENACTCPRGASCQAAGKHPVLPAWSTKFLSLEELMEFFDTAVPYNLGIVTGEPSNICVVDVDVRSGGGDSLQQLADQGLDLPASLLSHTGGGGYHLIYQLPAGERLRSSAGSVAPGIDIRAAGGMIVVPPSVHKSGALYQWDESVDEDTCADEIPEQLLVRMRSAARPELVIEPGRKLIEGNRHPPLMRIAGMLHRYGLTEQGMYRVLRALDSELCEPSLGEDEIKSMANSSGKWEPQNEGGFFDPKNYLGLAQSYLLDRRNHPDGRTLHYWQGLWLAWDGTSYRETDGQEIRAEAVKLHACLKVRKIVNKEVKEEPFKPNIQHGNEFLRALETHTILPADTPWPSWAGTQEREHPADQLLPCRNGLLHVQTRELLKHTPAYRNRYSLEIDWDAGAPEPEQWLSFLREIWEDDQESIDALQQIVGYLVAGGLEHQAMFLILGPPRSGKGTIGAVLENLVGKNNSASPTLSCLASSFGLEPLIDKRLALISDCRLGKRADQSAIVEKLLPYSAGDTLLANRKHQKMLRLRPTARFLFLTNELPGFFDVSGALASRFVMLRLRKSYLGREDRTLLDRLLTELPGILLWALEGLDRLRDRGRFLQPQSSQDLVEDLHEMTSQVSEFIRQKCELSPRYSVERKVLWVTYNRWLAEEQGWHSSITSSKFTGELRAACPSVSKARPLVDGRRPRVWTGIRLRPPEAAPSQGMLPTE